METAITLANFVAFSALWVVWRHNTWLNFSIKCACGTLAILNLAVAWPSIVSFIS